MNFSDTKIIVTSIVHVTEVKSESNDPVVHFKNRSYYGLAIKISGHAVYCFKDKIVDSTANTLVFLPKGIDYDVSYPEAGECLAVNFMIEGLPEMEPFVLEATAGDVFIEKFYKLLSAWQKSSSNFDYKCYSILYDILSFTQKALLTEYYPSYKVAKLEQAKSYIAGNFTKPSLSLSEVSKACGISEVYVRKLFTEIMHVSPTNYITFLRIKYARDLLASGESVSSAATKAGYNDAFYFSKRFSKEVGVSPSQYRADNSIQ